MNMQFLAIHYSSGVFGEIQVGEGKQLKTVCQGSDLICVLNLKDYAALIQSPIGFSLRVLMSCEENSNDCKSDVELYVNDFLQRKDASENGFSRIFLKGKAIKRKNIPMFLALLTFRHRRDPSKVPSLSEGS